MTPDDVLAMPLDEFERTFGFRPVDAIEKKWFAMLGERLNPICRAYIIASDEVGDLSKVNMDDSRRA